MDTLTKELENSHFEDANNMNKFPMLHVEELDLERVPAQSTEDPTQKFLTRSEVQALIAGDMKDPTSHRNDPMLPLLEREKLIYALQFPYDDGKEE